MNLIVTGSRSFIGSELLTQCRARNHQVIAIDASTGGEPSHIEADIRDTAIESILPGGSDALIHLAAISRDPDCRLDPQRAFDINVGGTLNLIRAAEARRIRQFVFASSEWVYGEVENDAVQTEDSLIDASRIVSEYALTKIAGERLLAMAHREGRLPAATILRFAIVYGPRRSNWSAVESLFHAVQRDNAVDVKGSLATARRFIHVRDAASGILASIGRTGIETFNLSGNSLIRLRDVVEASSRLLDRTPAIIEANPAAVSIRNPDNAKARRMLGWQPQVDLIAGLETLCSRKR